MGKKLLLAVNGLGQLPILRRADALSVYISSLIASKVALRPPHFSFRPIFTTIAPQLVRREQ